MKQVDISNFKQLLSSTDFNSVLSDECSNSAYNTFLHVYKHVYNKAFPLKKCQNITQINQAPILDYTRTFMYDFTHPFLTGSFEIYIVVDTGHNYTITTRHHHHIFKTSVTWYIFNVLTYHKVAAPLFPFWEPYSSCDPPTFVT